MCLRMPPLLTTQLMSAAHLAGPGTWHGDGITQDAAVPRSRTPQLPAAALPWNALCLHFPNTHSMAALLSGKEQGYQLPHQQEYLTTLVLLDFVRPQNGKGGPGRWFKQALSGPAAHPWLWEAAGSRWDKQGSITLQQSSFCLADSVLHPVAAPQPLSPCARASSKQLLLLPDSGRWWWLGHCARVNIYAVRAFLPLPCIFSPS